MAEAQKTTESAKSGSPTEASPLLLKDQGTTSEPAKTTWPKSVAYRVLLAGFIISFSFGVTQVPMIYVFGLMSCEDYYRHHKLPPPNTPAYEHRCNVHSIEASTARSVALVGASTTFFGVANLFITGWMIKAWGIKRALLISTAWPAVRLFIQNVGVEVGSGLGIIIVQLSQVVTIVGGPAGYILALNSFATEVVRPSERTSTIGRLTGCAMFGTAAGFLLGGLLADWLDIKAPFRITLVLFLLSAIYVYICLPFVPLSEANQKKATKSIGAFFEPLKMFTPQKWLLPDGTVRREYGVLLLGIGAFTAVLATGFIPTMLQMYATSNFGFGTSDNSELIGLNFSIRATYLTFAFPWIINTGRKWMKKGDRRTSIPSASVEDLPPTNNEPFPPGAEILVGDDASDSDTADDEEHEPLTRTVTSQSMREANQSFEFDLLYTRWSLILDGVLTSLATFTTKGWQVYLVAVILPFAAGTGSAAKGCMLQMCTPDQRVDALSAIALVDSIARLSTVSLFGLIFSAFAEIGKPSLTFAVNGAVALTGFIVLLFTKFPPNGAVRFTKEEEHDQEVGAT
jgi:MFS family permease